jgi:hypothetical protein
MGGDRQQAGDLVVIRGEWPTVGAPSSLVGNTRRCVYGIDVGFHPGGDAVGSDLVATAADAQSSPSLPHLPRNA